MTPDLYQRVALRRDVADHHLKKADHCHADVLLDRGKATALKNARLTPWRSSGGLRVSCSKSRGGKGSGGKG
jgi:hypothetical protein